MRRQLLTWILLAVVPFTNLRMICFNHAAGDGGAGVSASAAPADCDEWCPREKPPAASGDIRCMLVADDCSILLAAMVALPALPARWTLTVDAAPVVLDAGASYSAPPLLTHSPPPKR